MTKYQTNECKTLLLLSHIRTFSHISAHKCTQLHTIAHTLPHLHMCTHTNSIQLAPPFTQSCYNQEFGSHHLGLSLLMKSFWFFFSFRRKTFIKLIISETLALAVMLKVFWEGGIFLEILKWKYVPPICMFNCFLSQSKTGFRQ